MTLLTPSGTFFYEKFLIELNPKECELMYNTLKGP